MSLSHQHDDAGAIVLLRDVCRRYPRVVSPRVVLALALLRQGQEAEAKSLLEQIAVDFAGHDNNPREVVAAVDGLDKVEAANPLWPERRSALLEDAMRRHPDTWELVLISVRPGDGAPPTPPARARVAAFVAAHWWHAPARLKLGGMDAELGRLSEALAEFQLAARLDVHDDNALAAAAEICLRENRVADAVTFQQRAVRRQPDSPQQRFIFARILQCHGDQALADRQLAMANDLVRLVQP